MGGIGFVLFCFVFILSGAVGAGRIWDIISKPSLLEIQREITSK